MSTRDALGSRGSASAIGWELWTGGCDGPPNGSRKTVGPCRQRVSDMPEVAGEALVAAVAVERHRDVAAGELGEVEARDRGGVRVGLAVLADELRDNSTASGLTTNSWWSVAKRSATARAWQLVVAAASSKPIEKVFTGCVEAAAISATTIEESTPPERNAPSGTSAIIRRRTARRSGAEAPPPAPWAPRCASVE